MKSFVNKNIFSIAVLLFISVSSHANDDIIPVNNVRENVDRKIYDLNRAIKTKSINLIDKYDMPELPRSFLVSSLGKNANKIIGLIDFLAEERDCPECAECIDLINKLFYLQVFKVIEKMSFDGLVDPSLSREQKLMAAFETKKRLFGILHKMYYGSDSFVLPINATKGFVGILGAKANARFGLRERLSALHIQLIEVKNGWLDCVDCVRRESGATKYFPGDSDFEWFIDTIGKGLIISESEKTFGATFSRWLHKPWVWPAVKATLWIGGIAAAVYIVHVIMGGLVGGIKEAKKGFVDEKKGGLNENLERQAGDIFKGVKSGVPEATGATVKEIVRNACTQIPIFGHHWEKKSKGKNSNSMSDRDARRADPMTMTQTKAINLPKNLDLQDNHFTEDGSGKTDTDSRS